MNKQLIQYISNNNNVNQLGEILEISKLSNPKSLDEFEITVIDLNGTSVWKGNTSHLNSVYCEKDLKNLSIMIKKSKKTKVLFLYPQNCIFYYNPSNYEKNRHLNSIELKNMLSKLENDFMEKIFNIPEHRLLFENTKTKIAGKKVSANFYFSKTHCELTKSEYSHKATTVQFGSVVLTTLSISPDQTMIDFLRHIKLIQDKEKAPEWISTINMFDDMRQEQIIDENNEIIETAKKAITEAQTVIDKNDEYKSILYTNGNELVTVVFDILQQILDYDLSNFVDKNKEDFNMKFEDITFIGEIKGVTSNIKSEHISQLDVHLQSYLDKLADEEKSENVKSILIMDHQRTKDITLREPVHKNQINLAKRNGSLIIETNTLLKVFEKYLNNELDTLAIKKLFVEKNGLLEL